MIQNEFRVQGLGFEACRIKASLAANRLQHALLPTQLLPTMIPAVVVKARK